MGGVAISSARGVQKTQMLVSKVVDEVFGKNNFHVVWIASELDTMSYRHIKTTICKNSQRFRPVDFSYPNLTSSVQLSFALKALYYEARD